jgi:hypothetical protein
VGLFHRHHWFISSVQHGQYGLLLAPMEDTRCTTVFRRCRLCPRVKSNILTGHHTINGLYESGHFKRTSPPSTHTSDGSPTSVEGGEQTR